MDNSNAYFTIGNKLCLLDCGETAFGRIWNRDAYLDCEEVVVFITHLHADHVGSLGSLISYSYYVTGKKVTVVHPLDTIVQLLDLLGIDRACYRFRRLKTGETAEFEDGLRVKPLLVEHVPNMSCFGYLLADGKERIYFSGDARSIPDEVVEGLMDGSLDRVYQDTSNKESDHPTHALLSFLEELIPPAQRSRVYCMHLDYDYGDLLRSKGFGVVKVEC
jgi:ribonuclease BN (tRNA processing enzyme)